MHPSESDTSSHGRGVGRSVAVVVPIYDEEEIVEELWRRLQAVADGIPELSWRFVFVDDGSGDGSLRRLLELAKADERITVLELSRNFGHQAALTAGLDAARADAVVLIDGDLQDPPEVIPDLVAAWREGAEVVHARRRSRVERGLRRVLFELFHRVILWLSDSPLPPRSGVLCLLDRGAAKELSRLPERNRYLPGLRGWIGFREATVDYDRAARAGGEPKQSLGRLVRYGMDAVFSFSLKPLRLMTFSGMCVSGLGFVLAAHFVVKRLLGIETAETGFTTLVTLVLFLGGVQLVAIGVLGEYVGRIYDESKRRPLYLVRRCWTGGEALGDEAPEPVAERTTEPAGPSGQRTLPE